jgi:hypothetical protein
MTLYVCYGTFTTTPRPGGHPCGNAYRALRDAGHDPKVKRAYGLGMLGRAGNFLAPGRRKVKELTGSYYVPALVLDDGEVIAGSEKIVAWAGSHTA